MSAFSQAWGIWHELSAESYLNLVVIVSPFALEPSIELLCVESVLRYPLDSVPGHGDSDLVIGGNIPRESDDECAAEGESKSQANLADKADFVSKGGL
jgi:hypothetical protein